MSKKKKSRAKIRSEPQNSPASVSWLCAPDAWETLVCNGYTRLDQNPEICAAVDTIARLMGSMTIHLMENSGDGDKRIVNGLSRKMDIDPSPYMDRSNFIHWIVKTMFLGGSGNAVVYPQTNHGLLDAMHPIPPGRCSFLPDGWGYKILLDGQSHDPAELLHFVLNPDENRPWMGAGYRVALKDVAQNLKQAAATEKGFMESKWKPSVIVRVDALTEEFRKKAGRRRLLEEYIETDAVGTPWVIPAGAVDVQTVKPLSLADLAIADVIQLDKRTVASILGIPPFVLGVGDFNRNAWNNFISARLMPLAKIIEQQLTTKLLHRPEWYFRFNSRSLYSYDLKDLAEIASGLYVRGAMDGNELRDWVGLTPREGLNELIILENYIPRGMIGDQAKLQGGD